jgi:pyruvate, water dikinase
VRVLRLSEVEEERDFGGKAMQLGTALRAGLPVPEGVALAVRFVEAAAAQNKRAIAELAALHASFEGPLAVRSSVVGEDSAEASFAGQHRTCLNVVSMAELIDAVREVWRSASSDSALAYRRRLGISDRPRVALVIQKLVEPDTAGVLFTRNPIDGSDERVIEATWGLGEAVVAGRVIPDRYRVSRSGEVLERASGVKEVAVRVRPGGGTSEQKVEPEQVERLCLGDAQLFELHLLAERCEEVFGAGRDLEWAFAGDALHLLQCRAVTRTA